MTKEELISQITSTISANGNQDITGTKLQEVLVSIVDTLYSAIDEATIDASPEDFTELILQTLGSRTDATVSQNAITNALTDLNYGINAIPMFARVEHLSADIRPVVIDEQALIPGEIVYVTFEPSFFNEGLYEGFYLKVESGEYYTWFENAHLYKTIHTSESGTSFYLPRHNKLFECAEDGKQYFITQSDSIHKPNLVILGTDSGSAVVESNDIPKFDGIIEGDIAPIGYTQTYEGIYYSVDYMTFVAKLGSDYYLDFDGEDQYNSGPGPTPSRLFECNKQLYMYDGESRNLRLLSDMTKMAGYTYIGVATPSTTPIELTGNEKVFYIATEEGMYLNFGVDVDGLTVIKSDNKSWKADDIGRYLLHTTGGTMLGDIDMNGKMIHNIGIAEVNSLPTYNLYEGRMVRFKNKTYTFYNGLWLALSDDLRGHANDTHEENFVYQPTASDLSVKDGFADIKKLKGNTVVWNQIIKIKSLSSINEFTIEKINNYTFKLNGTLTKGVNASGNGFALLGNNFTKYPFSGLNKIILKLEHISGYASHDKIYLGNGYFGAKKIGENHLVTPLSSAIEAWTSTNLSLQFGNDAITFEDYVFSVQCFDLTKMFGEGNEPTTVEEFEAMFPNDYYEYNEGELMSFDGKGLKSVGFNAFDGEQAKALKGQKYYLGGTYTALGFKENENSETIAFELPSDRYYTPTSNGYIVAAGENICINLSHSGYRDGEYEPYEDYKISFQEGKTISQLTGKLNGEGESVTIFPEGLRSAGEAFDEITYDEATGKHKAIKRIGSVDMGNLNWTYQEKFTRFSAKFESAVGTYNANLITPLYTTNKSPVSGSKIDKTIYAAEGCIFVNKFSDTDPASFKASLQGQILYYELAEPEVYELDNPINMSYEAYDFGTEEVLYNDDKEVNIPMKANIEYGFNAVDMIRNNFEEIRSLKERVTALEQAILQIQAANASTEMSAELQ